MNNTLNIELDSFDSNKIKDFLNNYNIYSYEYINVNVNGENVFYFEPYGNECILAIRSTNPNIIENAYSCVNDLIKVGKIMLLLNNESNYLNSDYSELDKFAKDKEIYVSLDGNFSLDDEYNKFRNMIESIKWFKNIINDYPLSALEKLTYAYDLMKTFTYKESQEDYRESRYPMGIIDSGNIVCVGYANMLIEILKDIDPNIEIDKFNVSCYEDDDKTLKGNHSRNIVRIEDEKYDVNGFYIIDATWDSYKENGKEKYGNDYNSLSLYKYFMVPINEYHNKFKHEKINEEETKLNPLQLINTNSKSLSFDNFLSLIRTVRISEGYNGEVLDNEINKIGRINGEFYKEEIDSAYEK